MRKWLSFLVVLSLIAAFSADNSYAAKKKKKKKKNLKAQYSQIYGGTWRGNLSPTTFENTCDNDLSFDIAHSIEVIGTKAKPNLHLLDDANGNGEFQEYDNYYSLYDDLPDGYCSKTGFDVVRYSEGTDPDFGPFTRELHILYTITSRGEAIVSMSEDTVYSEITCHFQWYGGATRQ